jgi:hypothetical protein
MNPWQLWFLVLVVGIILVVAYTTFVKEFVRDPTFWLSDSVWLFLHFVAGLITGIVLPNPAIQMVAFIVVWEIMETIFAKPFPQYFKETTKKSIYDAVLTTGGYILGQWLRAGWSQVRL